MSQVLYELTTIKCSFSISSSYGQNRLVINLCYKSVLINIYSIMTNDRNSLSDHLYTLGFQLAFSSTIFTSIQEFDTNFPGLFDKFYNVFQDISIQYYLLLPADSSEISNLNRVLNLEQRFIQFCYENIAEQNIANIGKLNIVAFNNNTYIGYNDRYAEVGVNKLITDNILITNLESKIGVLTKIDV